jgi:hypothetical protein
MFLHIIGIIAIVIVVVVCALAIGGSMLFKSGRNPFE